MTPEHYQFLTALLQRECGLVLSAEKTYLAESRLAPVARQFGHADIDQLIGNVISMRTRDSVRAIVEAMVTNETFFFRDRAPFHHFRTVGLPALIQERADRRRLRIWSAAASTGQEPYSIAMILADEKERLNGWQTSVLATDISERALARAKAGDYSQFEVQRGLPIKHLINHFEQKGERWRLKREVRRLATFEPHNLLRDPGRFGRFDAIFLRNVLIYFDVATRKQVLGAVARQLNPGGLLYLGCAESTSRLSALFTADPNVRGVYRLSAPATDARLAS